MAITRETKVTYPKTINGQNVTFNYLHGDNAAPLKVDFVVPIQLMNENAQGSYGHFNLTIEVAKKEEVKTAITSLVSSILNEIDNIVINYENPETV